MPSIQVSATSQLVLPQMQDANSLFAPTPYAIKSSQGSDNGKPVTGPQLAFDDQTGLLPHNNPFRFATRNRRWVNFAKMRTMRRDPTIALAREVGVAPIVGSSWTIELADDAPEELKPFLEKYLLPMRNLYLRTALFGEIDFGWRCYEKILTSVNDKKLGSLVIAERLKPLLNDTTWVKYDDNGDLDGMFNQNPTTLQWYWIDRAYSVFANFDDDGLGYYNDPRLLRAEGAYDEWHRINDVSRRFNEKFAGAVWVVHYPQGKSMWKGKQQDNMLIAQDIVYSIRGSGYLIMPSKLLADAQSEMAELGSNEWRIELIESSSKQGDFIASMDYQDKLKIRALGILERAVTEGNYGTKAESESHINVMLLNMQLKHEDLTELFNREVVDHLSILNYGEPGLAKFVAQPLTDERSDMFTAILTAMLSSPEQSAEVFDSIDKDEILKHLRVPLLTAAENGGVNSLFQLLKDSLTTDSSINDATDDNIDPVDETPILVSSN